MGGKPCKHPIRDVKQYVWSVRWKGEWRKMKSAYVCKCGAIITRHIPIVLLKPPALLAYDKKKARKK